MSNIIKDLTGYYIVRSSGGSKTDCCQKPERYVIAKDMGEFVKIDCAHCGYTVNSRYPSRYLNGSMSGTPYIAVLPEIVRF